MNVKTAQRLLDYCYELAAESNCQKRQFGSIIVPTFFLDGPWDDGPSVMVSGVNRTYNHMACNPCLRNDVPSGTRLELCRAVHSEQDALLKFLIGFGKAMKGFSLAICGRIGDKRMYKERAGFYCTFCARLLYVAGLDGIVIQMPDGPWWLPMDEAIEDAYAVATGLVDDGCGVR